MSVACLLGGPDALVILDDVTEERLRQRHEGDSARLSAVRQLAAGIAHEINNPLSIIAGFSELLMDRGVRQETQDHLQRIYSHSQRAAGIVQNLLSFAGRGEPHRSYIDLVALVERAMETKAGVLRESDIHVTREYPPGRLQSMVDQDQLLKVIFHVLANAQQAMAAHGGGAIVVGVHESANGNSIRISVADSGPGIPQEHLPRIFDPFFTTKDVGEGFGLGLSICYGIVRQHGGEISVESPEGEGTRVHIDLPVLTPEPRGTPPTPDAAPSPTAGQTILVVDDEPAMGDLLTQVLSDDGHKVDMALSGQDAWDLVQRAQYDCIIADLKMPGMTGQQLYELIRDTDPALAHKIIFITGDTARLGLREFLESSGNPLLGKPFRLADLRRQVRAVSADEGPAP